MRDAVRAIVFEEIEPMVRAQIAAAKGLSYLVVRDKKTGKFVRLTRAMAKGQLKSEETIEVWEKEPSTSAFTDLMNRTLDRPKEQEQEMRLTGDWDRLAARLASGRKRVQEKGTPIRAVDTK
jgi:MOSC domain-containing protein YiiM